MRRGSIKIKLGLYLENFARCLTSFFIERFLRDNVNPPVIAVDTDLSNLTSFLPAISNGSS